MAAIGVATKAMPAIDAAISARSIKAPGRTTAGAGAPATTAEVKPASGAGTGEVLAIEYKSAKVLRYEPGKVSGGEKLPVIREGDKWLRGTHGNAGKIPGQIAEQLRGREFKDFDDFRRTVWKLVADDPALSKSFTARDLRDMRKGLAPRVPKTQAVGDNQKYNLHHVTPLQHGGMTYDVDNITIVTPRYHNEILDPKHHIGSRR